MSDLVSARNAATAQVAATIQLSGRHNETVARAMSGPGAQTSGNRGAAAAEATDVTDTFIVGISKVGGSDKVA